MCSFLFGISRVVSIINHIVITWYNILSTNLAIVRPTLDDLPFKPRSKIHWTIVFYYLVTKKNIWVLKKKMYREMIKITSQKKKKLFKVRKINVTARPMLLFIEQVFDSSVISFIFHFYFPWLTIDHKIKCIQAKIFQTQVGWSLDSCTHRWD